MDIERLSPPAFDALSQEEIEQMLALDPQVDPDAVALMMASATAMVERQSGVTIAKSQFRITYTDGDAGCLRIPLYPVISVDSVHYFDASGSTAVTAFETIPGYTRRILTNAIPASVHAVTIEVTAGYSDPAMVPASLLHAVAVVMNASYDGRQEISPATLATVDRLCAPWRRMW